jgi:hypothetical protein
MGLINIVSTWNELLWLIRFIDCDEIVKNFKGSFRTWLLWHPFRKDGWPDLASLFLIKWILRIETGICL